MKKKSFLSLLAYMVIICLFVSPTCCLSKDKGGKKKKAKPLVYSSTDEEKEPLENTIQKIPPHSRKINVPDSIEFIFWQEKNKDPYIQKIFVSTEDSIREESFSQTSNTIRIIL